MATADLTTLLISAVLGAALMMIIVVILNRIIDSSAWNAVSSPYVSWASEYDEVDEARHSKLSKFFTVGAPLLAILVSATLSWTNATIEPISVFIVAMALTFTVAIGGRILHLTLKE